MIGTDALLHAVCGGLLIGAGVAVLMLCNGRVAGISGIAAEAMQGRWGGTGWRVAFLLGLVLPGAIRGVGPVEYAGALPWLAMAGLLVGFGTRLGSGCTSGHGVCGLSNLSRRSLVATATFMAFAMLTVYVARHGASP